jgi:hypothetical protein
MPAPLYLLSKKIKRCKTCVKQIIKPIIDPNSKETPKIFFLMMNNIVKVTIYRLGKVKPEQTNVDLFLQFRNPNITPAKIKFNDLLLSQTDGKGINVSMDLPGGYFTIDPVEQIVTTTQSVADTAGTNVKETVAERVAD